MKKLISFIIIGIFLISIASASIVSFVYGTATAEGGVWLAESDLSAQTFTLEQGYNVDKIRLYLGRLGAVGEVDVSIKEVQNDEPIGEDLSIGKFNGDDLEESIGDNFVYEWIEVDMTPLSLSSGEYAILISTPNAGEYFENMLLVPRDTENGYTEGRLLVYTTQGWQGDWGDMHFELVVKGTKLNLETIITIIISAVFIISIIVFIIFIKKRGKR